VTITPAIGLGDHPVYLNHNALYHLIEAVALFMIFRGAGWFVEAGRPARNGGAS
jgi:hypothetical protein